MNILFVYISLIKKQQVGNESLFARVSLSATTVIVHAQDSAVLAALHAHATVIFS